MLLSLSSRMFDFQLIVLGILLAVDLSLLNSF
jgi:hypothetical protein